MHDTAHHIGRLFFETYCSVAAMAVLEIGARDVNGTLRDSAPEGCRYTGVDLCDGPGVDIVVEDAHALPFDDEAFDAVVSSSCLEHDALFWLTFIEMLRVTKQGGFVYINAPSNGSYHSYPVDNWRFYPDAAVALTQWAKRQGYEAELVESFIARRQRDQWNDCVMVFRRGGGHEIVRRIVDRLPDALNVRRGVNVEVEAREESSEDMMLLAAARQALAASEGELSRLSDELRTARAGPQPAEPRWIGFEC